MDTVILILTGLFLLVITIYLIGYVNEMINHAEDISREYWNEYWEREEDDESTVFFETAEETRCDDFK